MLADHAAVGGDQFALSLRWRDSLLREICVDERGIIAVGDETDFLAIGLFRGGNAELAREFADLRLFKTSEAET